MIMYLARAYRSGRSASLKHALWLLVLLVTPLQLAVAQAEDDKRQEPIEEITSFGQKSLLTFRHEMEVAEIKYYDLYNTLNDEDEYDVICKDEVPTASRIKRRACKGRFEWEPIGSLEMNRLIGSQKIPQHTQVDIPRKRRTVLDKMEKLAEENPELREALFDLTRISMEFAVEKNKRCAGKLFCNERDDPEGE